ncbi:MAG: hypothetical protein JXQ96_20910 [Cyclobacteriaceae bacterium]
MKNSLFLVFILTSSMASAQYNVIAPENFVKSFALDQSTGKTNPDVKGSPYLNDEFVNGEVYYSGKYLVKGVLLRYNLHGDAIQFSHKGKVMELDPAMKIDKVIIGNDNFVKLKKSSSSKVPEGFVKVWNDQYPRIITKMKTQFFKKEETQAFSEPRPARYERRPDENFLMKEEGVFERVKSVKKLIQSLGDFQSELNSFAKKEKVSTNDASELAKLMDYYVSLK